MDKTIRVINELERKGVIDSYAIAGGIATIFYIEPLLTYDLDIFFVPSQKGKDMRVLSPIYDWLKSKGYKIHKEHIVIEGVPVQFIPVYNELVEDALNNAVRTKYEKVATRILRAEYLLAIMLQTSRPKDKERIIKLLDEARIDKKYLMRVLRKHSLDKKFKRFTRTYYEVQERG